MKRFLASFLAFAMVLSLCIVPSAAAGANVTMEVAPPDGKTLTTLSKGDEVKVTVKNRAMTVSSFACGFEFDADIFECISIEGGIEADKSKIYLVLTEGGLSPYAQCDASTTTQANNNKKVGFARGSATEVKYNAGTLAIVTFKVKKVGTASFKLYESSDGSGGFNGTNIVVTNTETLAGPYTGTVTVPEDSDLTITNTSVVVSNPATGHEYALTKKGEAAPSIYTSTAPIKFDGLTSETEYTLYVRVKGTSDHQASDASTKDIKTLSKPALPSSASVSITGTAKIGEKLTATPSGLPSDAGALTYKWYRGDDTTPISGADTDTYTPSTKDDVGKKIKVVVTAENYSGSQDATTTDAVVKAAYPGGTPSEKPTVLNVTDKQVTAGESTVLNCYGVTLATETDLPSNWTMSGIISGLNPNTKYKLWGCIVSDTVENSPATYVEFTTKKSSISDDAKGTLAGYTGVYDGNPHNAITGAAQTGYTVEYSTTSATSGFSGTMPKVTSVADSKTVWVKLSKADHEDKMFEMTATVTAKSISDAVITYGTQNTYNGAEQSVVIDSVKVDGTALTSSDYTITSGGTATDVEEKTLNITGKGNYGGTATAATTWKLVAKDVTITPDAKSKTYGAADPVLTYTTDISDTTLKDKFDTAKSGKLSYTGTNVGAYIIEIGTLKAGNNFNLKMNTTAVFFTINQATPVITATTPRQLVNNGMEVDISNWASFTNTDSSAELTYTLGSAPAGITLAGNKLKAASSVAAGATFEIKVNAYSTHNFTAPTEFTIHVTVVNKVDAGVSITTPPTSKTYGDADFTLTATKTASDDGAWSWSSSDTAILEITSGANTATPTIKVKKADTAGAILTVTYTSSTHYGSANATITVAPKTLTAADLTHSGPITKVYDTNTNAPTGLTVSVKSGSLVGTDTLAVTGTLKYNSANVNEANKITFTPDAITTGNYALAASEVLTITSAKITQATPTYTVPTGLTAKYGQTLADVNIAATTGWSWMNTGTAVGTPATKNFSAKFTPTDAINYKTVENIDVPVAVSKADAPTLADIPVSQKYTVDTEQSKNIGTAGMPEDAGNLTYVKGSESSTGSATIVFAVDGSTVKFTITGGAVGEVITLPVTIGSDNYENSTVNVKVTLTDKDIPTVSASDITVTYDGNAIPNSKITGTATFGGTPVPGTWAWKAGMAVTNVADTGTKTVTFNPTDSAAYGSVDTNITVTINKATPAGTPTYTAITTSGKKLSDAALASGSITPAGGSIAWDMAADTVVAANTAYGWTYTPAAADAANYTTLTGTITPYVVSYSGGGSYTPSYSITVDKTENGTITVSPKSASKGDTVTVTVKPDKGYELDTLKVLDKDGDALKLTEKNGKYTFKMPSGKVTVKGSFVEEAPEQIFKDVPVDAYYYEAVKWAAEKGITGGVGNGLFAPNQPCTRGQIVTFLWRAAGSPAPKSMSSFTDVPADAFYAKAVAWAVENGITGGTGDGKFSPDATCTRAQSVTFLYRAAGSPKVSGSAEFGDVATNAYYADAVAWAAKNGITGGIGGGLFGSGNDCTRAQIVTFLYRSVK